MKISVLCASRGNPSGLRTCMGALDALASGQNEIKYTIVCDEDDWETKAASVSLADSFIRPRGSLGGAWDYAAAKSPADVYALVTDRSLVVRPYWDVCIADAYKKDDRRVVWWTTNAGPVIPIVPEKWRQAAGQIYTDYFPFWFDDTWLQEVSAMVHGLPIYMVEAACFIHKKTPTTKRLRDLRFWMDFFIAKRPERTEHAKKIRESLGLPMPDIEPVEKWFRSNDEMWALNWQKWEELMGDKSEPDETYIAAKKSAEEFMNGRS